ncbi:MAG TPA: flagellin [Fimbriimonadaceae bacterium]|jgi:flagellin
MSFRINTNVSALDALTNLDNVSSQLSTSENRLSTGLQINSGADNPAGLIISQEFQAQIVGINQAIQNNQDVLNYAKTADGALSEVSTLLDSARALAVSSANSGVLDPAALQANQTQLNSIVSSITRIAQTTQFGTKNILDGSAGVTATVTNAADIGNLGFTGNFKGQSVTTNSAFTIAVTHAATEAVTASSNTFAFATTTLSAGSFTINGTTFTTSSNETVANLVQSVNAAQNQTGITATYTAGGAITLTQNTYGSNFGIDLSDANGILLSAPGSVNVAGTDATGTGTITTASGLVTVAFTGGQFGANGLALRDADGNTFSLTDNGNLSSGAVLAGQLTVGSTQFQIGGNAGQTASLSIGNFASDNLGTGAVSGLSLANLDLTTATGATNALEVIDAAIQQVAVSRGNIGAFETDVVQANINSLNAANESLTSTNSDIVDVNVAAEMTNYTKLQILQQAGLAVLGQANSNPQNVLSLIKGG